MVEVSPDNKPPVCKLMDFGKYKYEQQKKAAEARKKQKVIEIKEIKMRPTIDDHDYDVKMRAMKRFFDEGDKVKVTLRFRGREMAHQHLGMDLLTRVQKDTEIFAKLEQYPKMEGRQMMMVLAPKYGARTIIINTSAYTNGSAAPKRPMGARSSRPTGASRPKRAKPASYATLIN